VCKGDGENQVDKVWDNLSRRTGLDEFMEQRCWRNPVNKGVGENSVEKVLDKLRGKGVGHNDMGMVLVKMEEKRCWTK
jgi:hypothetical protein